MDGSDTPSHHLSYRTRLEAGLLALPPAAMAAAWLWINEPDTGGGYQIGIGMTLLALPLFAVTRRAFVILSLVIAWLLGYTVVLAMALGLFLFFPVAVMLLAAAAVTALKPPARLFARIAAWLLAAAAVAAYPLVLPLQLQDHCALAAPETVRRAHDAGEGT